MIERFKSWLKIKFSGPDFSSPDPMGMTGAHSVAPPKKAAKTKPHPIPVDNALGDVLEDEGDSTESVTIEDAGPGKNKLIRNKYIREDTGTHETLKILDDSLVDSGEEPGIDPYNTGGFDRSKNWHNRFRK
jgi:hypothetical protein